MLVEENNIISDEEEIADMTNNYLINVTKTLNLKKTTWYWAYWCK